MTSTTGNNGRLGNQIIRNLAVSLIAEKYNLQVDYFRSLRMRRLYVYNEMDLHLQDRSHSLFQICTVPNLYSSCF